MAPAKKAAKKKAPANKAATKKAVKKAPAKTVHAQKPSTHTSPSKTSGKNDADKFDLFSIFRTRAAEENAHGGPSGAI